MPKGGEKYGAWYDADTAEKAVQFFPMYLRHTEAEWWGKPFVLSPWQERIVRTVFGWKRADETRLIRQLYLEVPRKNGKTEFAAGLSLLVMLADGEFGGQGYFMACGKEQADDTVFKKVGIMVGLSEALSKDVVVYKTSIYIPSLMASLKTLSSKAATKHGFSPTFALGDELHEWPDGEVHEVVHKGTGARRQPLEVLITTAGEPGVGYGWELHEYAELVVLGDVEDPTFYAEIFAADPEDDWTKPETWAKANPNLGISIKKEYLESEVAKAHGNARKIADFKRYHLNIWNEKAVSGINMSHWDSCPARPVTLESLKGRCCFGALDLSATTDLTSLFLGSPWDDGGGYDFWWKFWMPTEGLKERVRRDRVPYDRWIADGWIIGTEGNVVDYDAIRAYISGGVGHDLVTGPPVKDVVDLVDLAIDRWNATQLVTQLTQDGVNVVAFGQGFASMSAPSKEFERLIGARLINHGGNPVARWMASNTKFMSDGAENVKPVKPDRKKSVKRIDGIVTAIMGTGRAIAYTQDDGAPLISFA
jgi:phage terminase large subunit-like protein